MALATVGCVGFESMNAVEMTSNKQHVREIVECAIQRYKECFERKLDILGYTEDMATDDIALYEDCTKDVYSQFCETSDYKQWVKE